MNGSRMVITVPKDLAASRRLDYDQASEDDLLEEQISDQEVTRGPAPRRAKGAGVTGKGGDTVTAPMQATVVTCVVEEGQSVQNGDLVVVLEAMKMEQSIYAHGDGVVRSVDAPVGQTVPSGHVLLSIVDEEEA